MFGGDHYFVSFPPNKGLVEILFGEFTLWFLSILCPMFETLNAPSLNVGQGPLWDTDG